jgi:hypothetical protein
MNIQVTDCPPPSQVDGPGRHRRSRALGGNAVGVQLFARVVAARDTVSAGRDYDDDLLFAGCVMHDLGVASDGPNRQRFEVEGADRAAEFLTARGISGADADSVWQAIALRTSSGIAERRGTLCVLVRRGVALDRPGVRDRYTADDLRRQLARTAPEQPARVAETA